MPSALERRGEFCRLCIQNDLCAFVLKGFNEFALHSKARCINDDARCWQFSGCMKIRQFLMGLSKPHKMGQGRNGGRSRCGKG